MGADGAAAVADRPPGLEIFEIKPVILGGDPVDAGNKMLLTREQHIEAVRYWNGFICDLRREEGRGGDTTQ